MGITKSSDVAIELVSKDPDGLQLRHARTLSRRLFENVWRLQQHRGVAAHCEVWQPSTEKWKCVGALNLDADEIVHVIDRGDDADIV